MSTRDLTDLIEAFASQDTAPDVLFLGDSVYMCTSSQDVCTESLANMLVRKGDAHLRKRAFACGAFHGTMFLEIIDRVLAKPYPPKAIVLPVNIRSFSPQWFSHPAYQFEHVRTALQEYDRQGGVAEDFEIRYPQHCDYAAYDRAEHTFFGHGKCHLGEFRKALDSRPTTAEEAAHRKRIIFTFFYLNHLQPNHPLLHTWMNLLQRLADEEVHLFAYLTPINRACGDKYVGAHFSQNVAENAARVREVFTSLGDNAFLHYADWCLDFGQDVFVYDENPDEHLNYRGREILTDRIHEWLQTDRVLPAEPPIRASCASVTGESEDAVRKGEPDRSDEANSHQVAMPHPSIYQGWLNLNSVRCNRLYYRDQSSGTLSSLAGLAQELDPSVVVELGTLAGLSLRTWVAATTRARIFAVDLSFKTLHETMHFLPVDLSRVTLLEQDILKTDFSTMWGPDDRVILFVDAHDLPGVPIMDHVLTTALPSLPDGSCVIVDDLWFSEDRLTRANARIFLDDRVVPQIDELQCFNGHYAPYHQGGSFMGFAEVIPLLKFVNRHGIELVHEKGSKHVSFTWRREYLLQENTPTGQDATEAATCCGSVMYNPLESVSTCPSLRETMQGIAAGYQKGRVREVAENLASFAAQYPQDQGLSYGRAVCLARSGMLVEARRVLERGRQETNHPRYQRLLTDLIEHLKSSEIRRPKPPTERLDVDAMTIFAMPKPFAGHIATIQKNAIRSWARLNPAPEILLFGDEPGIKEIAREVGARHIPEVGRNEFGTPRVDKLFEAAQEHASHGVLAYVNADMILFQDFADTARRVRTQLPNFLLIGQRWDLPLTDEIDFTQPQWRELLREQLEEHSILHSECGLDYFVFPKGLWERIPPLAIGRTAWDNWLVLDPGRRNVPVVDGTESITAVQQDHDYGHVAGGRREAWLGVEAERNRKLVGPVGTLGYASGASWVMHKDGTLKQVQPRAAKFLSDGYREERSLWLLRQANRLAAAGKIDLAVCKCEEAKDLLEIWLESKRLSGKRPESMDYAHAAKRYLSGFLSLAQCYMQMGRPEGVIALYTRLLKNPVINIPGSQRERIARVRDRLVCHSEQQGRRNDPPAAEIPSDVGDAAKSRQPKITIITACLNGERHLRECIESVLNQTMPDWELILLDDGSADGTRSIMADYVRRDNRIRSFCFDDNKGPYVRRNFAIERARAAFIVIQDADDIMCPDKLERLYEVINEDSRLGMVGSFYRMFLDGFPDVKHCEDVPLVTDHEEILRNYRMFGACDWCPHGIAIIRKKLFDDMGPYDENPFGADSFWLAKVLEYATRCDTIRLKTIPEFLTLRRMHLDSQKGKLPSFDMRSRRFKYWECCRGRLREVGTMLDRDPTADVKAELRKLNCNDFMRDNGHLFAKWESEPLTAEAMHGFWARICRQFAQGQFVRCISTCAVVENLVEGISQTTRGYDLIRGAAYFALGLLAESRECIRREFVAHGMQVVQEVCTARVDGDDLRRQWNQGVDVIKQAVLAYGPASTTTDALADMSDADAVAEPPDPALDELERKFNALPDGSRGKQVLAVRIAEIAQRLRLHEMSRAWETKASDLKDRRPAQRAAEPSTAKGWSARGLQGRHN